MHTFKCTGCETKWNTPEISFDILLEIARHVDYWHGQQLKQQMVNYALAVLDGEGVTHKFIIEKKVSKC